MPTVLGVAYSLIQSIAPTFVSVGVRYSSASVPKSGRLVARTSATGARGSVIGCHSPLRVPIAIDTQFTVSEADKLAEAVKRTGKPLKAIVITHPHPDHYNGTCRLLQFAKVRIYATQATIDGIRATAEAKRTEWKPTYGKDYPDSTCVPDHVLPVRGTVQIDGVKFQSRDYGPGEAITESIVLAPSLRAAFVGDVIYDRVHPWLAEGRSTPSLQ